MRIIDLLLITEKYKKHEIDHQMFKKVFNNSNSIIN